MESNKLDDGWLESSWFGKFYNNSSNWIYHYPLGWLYLHSLHPDGFWIWDDLEKQWLWTKEGVFPWFFKTNPDNWLYHKLDQSEIRVFDYQNNLWNKRN